MERLIAEILADRELARQLKQPSAAIKATALLAALTGHLAKREEHGKPGEFSGLLPAEQILAEIRLELGDEAAAAIERAMAR